MLTEIDEGKGLVKTTWAQIRDRVAQVAPAFAKHVDELSPDKTFPLYLAYFPYGALKGDTQSPLIPKVEGGQYRLSDPDAPKDVIKNLGYGKYDAPLGLVLEKSFEFFMDSKDEGITIPRIIYTPGMFTSLAKNLNRMSQRQYSSNKIYMTVAGARSVFMLPSIGCASQHSNLEGAFNTHIQTPKRLYDHWPIFKELTNSTAMNCSWRACQVYFSEKWITHLHTDKAWLPLKMFLYELAWNDFQYERSRHHYDIAFSIIQRKRNLKPNPYLAGTLQHLFAITLGAAPGYTPASDDTCLPLEEIQSAYVKSYGLKKHLPTIMHPKKFILEKDKFPIYYSLQHPSTHIFSPKSRMTSSTLYEMHELIHIAKIFFEELGRDDGICSDSILHKTVKEMIFRYFHNERDKHNEIHLSKEVTKFDKRLEFINPAVPVPSTAQFASDSTFLRGCVSITTSK